MSDTAYINNIYVFVESEEISYGVEATSHPVEEGIDITDNVKKKARTITLSGEIVEKVGDDEKPKKSQLLDLHQRSVLVTYTGRITLSNCIIEDISLTNTYDVWGASKCSITLKEIRTAKSAVKDKDGVTKSGTQQTKKNSSGEWVYHTVKKGDCVWALVAAPNAPYKSYGASCAQVMAWNPTAFSRKGDFRTLRIGFRLKVGRRK